MIGGLPSCLCCYNNGYAGCCKIRWQQRKVCHLWCYCQLLYQYQWLTCLVPLFQVLRKFQGQTSRASQTEMNGVSSEILPPYLFSAWYSSLKFFCVQILCSSSVLCSCNTALLSLVLRLEAVTWPGLTLNFQMDFVHSWQSQHAEHLLEFHHISPFVAWLWKWMLLTKIPGILLPCRICCNGEGRQWEKWLGTETRKLQFAAVPILVGHALSLLVCKLLF